MKSHYFPYGCMPGRRKGSYSRKVVSLMTVREPGMCHYFIIISLLLLLIFLVTGCVETSINPEGDKPTMSNQEDELYKDLSGWERVYKLEEKGLTQSILKELETLYSSAKKEKKQDELIKVFIYQLKYESKITEDANVEVIKRVRDEIATAAEPGASILTSILADFYWQYYENNRYTFSQRTPTIDFENSDINTWDLSTLIAKISELYSASLKQKDILQKTDIKEYDLILYPGNSRDIRPTLFDFIAHRAFSFFSSEESSLTQPAYRFEVDNEELFGTPERFSALQLSTEDVNSLKYNALLILQELTAFHLKDTEPSALIYLTIERLKFVRRHAVEMDKDGLYIKALTSLEQKYSKITPAGQIGYEIALFYNAQGNKFSPLTHDMFKNDKGKAFDICKEVMAKFPGSEGAINCRSLQDIISAKYLQFTLEKATIPDRPFRALVTYRNVKTLYFRLISLDENQRNEAKVAEYDNGSEGILSYYLKQTIVASWQIDLPDDHDFNEYSTEIKIPALNPGYYVLIASGNENYSFEGNSLFFSPVWISNISFIVSDNWQKGTKNYYVTDRDSGVPLKGVKAQILESIWSNSRRRYVYKNREKYTTDGDGYFEIKTHKSRDFAVKFTYKKDVLLFDDQFYQYQPYQDDDNPVSTLFFTDRAIYRPGQTIYYKGIVIKKLNKEGDKKKVAENYTSTVYFYDVNSQVISEKKVKTNEYGTFSGSFTAPADRLPGNMRIGNETGSHSISVEEYKRPLFEVIFDPMKESYKLGTLVTAHGQGKAYSGFGIDNAQVRYRVVRNATYPYWRWYWGPYPASGETEIKNGTTNTDEKGEFTIQFKALPDLSLSKETLPVFTYTVIADVTDINGETQSSRTTIRIGYVALSIDINIPEKIISEKTKEFEIQSQNLNYEFEPAQGSIAIYSLKTPGKLFRTRMWERPSRFIYTKEDYYINFPYDLYADENSPDTWEKEKKVFTSAFHTEKEKKLTLQNLGEWNQGKYLLELITKDKYGYDIRIEKYFTLYSQKEKKLPVKESVWYNPIHTFCEPGDTATIELGTSEPDISFMYEVFHKDKVVTREILTLHDERRILSFPVKEEHRGNFVVHINTVKHNRAYSFNETIYVGWKNKELNIEFETFRDKLLPGENEEWKIKISGNKGEKVAAEMAAALYDASLDAFRQNNWETSFYPSFYSYRNWQGYISFTTGTSRNYEWNWNTFSGGYDRDYDSINYYGFSFAYMFYRMKSEGAFEEDMVKEKSIEAKDTIAPAPIREPESGKREADAEPVTTTDSTTVNEPVEEAHFDEVKVRTNLNETAFFYPHLLTDKDGKIIISFTIPEALTRWKMLGFAHTKDLSYGFTRNELVTQKDLMIIPNPPRFLRENDTISFTAKVTNLADSDLSGNAVLELYDALTMKPVDVAFKNNKALQPFTVKKEQSTSLAWDLVIPEQIQAVTFRVIAKAGNFSDGEERIIPVLTNRMMVTESLPLPIKGNETKTFTFAKLVESGKSKTLTHHKVTLEFTSNPAWYAIQALPYIMEYPYECSEQVFSRYYANSIASHVANSSPGIKKVFESWKGSNSLISNLEKNEELKSLLLQETPWVLNSQDETERKKRVGLLFDLNRMSHELKKALQKIIKLQASNGGWPWFPGLPDDRYITQHIAAGMGHLDRLGIKEVKDNTSVRNMIQKALYYCDARIHEDYTYLIKNKIKPDQNNLGYLGIHYLYTRSFFTDIPVADTHKEAFDYWYAQAEKYWLDFSVYLQGMISLALNRYGNHEKAMDIIRSLKENAIVHEELGMYWKSNTAGYYWYQAPIETQSLLIETFTEVARDKNSVEEMKIWLLKQKQTQDWKTTKATADACYALLLQGSDLLKSKDLVEITLGTMNVDPLKLEDVKVEAGTGYFKTSWSGSDIKPEMGNIILTKKDDGIAWGALYWQYFEQLDKITTHKTPLALKKKLFLQVQTDKGPVIKPIAKDTPLTPGDLVIVRIELTTDRDMEYMHLKDMRASCLEPTNVISRYKYQDGLWYYESTKDASTNFFIPWIRKGTYVFEYSLRISHTGNFSNGITTIQCMYAPEFTSHSEGVRITVK
ncbi:MAG: hypothetical protein JXJ04_05150 [Spirochaetales bacterium]|nr:hypothetical protein [Spirochaetales bacterium]